MAYKLIKAAMAALVGIGLMATAASAGSVNYTTGSGSMSWTALSAITADYTDAAQWVKSEPPNVTTIGMTAGFVAQSDTQMNIVTDAIVRASDEAATNAKVVAMAKGLENKFLYRGTDRLYPMTQTVAKFYGTDRLIHASGYHASNIDAQWNTGPHWTDWKGFEGFTLNAALLRGTDRI